MTENTYLLSSEAAQLLRLSTSTLAKYRQRGDGPPFSKTGRVVLYCISDLHAWLAARKRNSTSEE